MSAAAKEELRLADLETFLAVARVGSINGAARSLEVTPSQVSKAFVRLERQLATRLLVRGPRGVLLTDSAHALVTQVVDVLARARALRTPGKSSQLTIAAAAYLTAFFAPALVAAAPELDVHSVETAPGLPSAYVGLSHFDVVLSTGSQRWPESWQATRVATLRKALYAAPARAARLRGATPAQLLGEVFIGPIYGDREQVVPGDDGCPLSHRVRHFGHRTQSVAVALALASRTTQLVFAPEVAARAFVKTRALVEIPVEGWNVREPLMFISHQERVAMRVQRKLLAAVRAAIDSAS